MASKGANCPYQTNDDEAVKLLATLVATSETDVYGIPHGIKRNYGYAAAAGYDFDFGLGLNAGYAYSDLEAPPAPTTGDKKEGPLGAHYAINGFYFAGMYTQGDLKNDNTGSNKDKGVATSWLLPTTLTPGPSWLVTTSPKARTVHCRFFLRRHVDETLLGVQYNFTPSSRRTPSTNPGYQRQGRRVHCCPAIQLLI